MKYSLNRHRHVCGYCAIHRLTIINDTFGANINKIIYLMGKKLMKTALRILIVVFVFVLL